MSKMADLSLEVEEMLSWLLASDCGPDAGNPCDLGLRNCGVLGRPRRIQPV